MNIEKVVFAFFIVLADPEPRLQLATLVNSNVLDYVVYGRDMESGWLWRLLTPPRRRST